MYHPPSRSSGLRVRLTGVDLPGSNEAYAPYHDEGASPDHELCLIDAGIKSLLDVPLFGANIQTLNLHCNQIAQIENLEELHTLRHLDLSSNQITAIKGLKSVTLLRTLNLACNGIQAITGLAGLRSLTRLNLSYNKISDVSGLADLHGSSYALSHLELQGNQIGSVEHLITSLRGLVHLTSLTLMHDGSSNPICQLPGYRASVLHSLPRLKVLDGMDRNSRQVVKDGDLDDIPGLEQYLDFLLSSESSTVQGKESILNIVTPRIDQALEKFKQRAVVSSEASTTTDMDAGRGKDVRVTMMKQDNKTGHLAPDIHVAMMKQSTPNVNHERRLEQLEQQLADILERRNQTTAGVVESDSTSPQSRMGNGGKKKSKAAKRDTDETEESDEENVEPNVGKHRHTSRQTSGGAYTKKPGNRKQQKPSRARLKEQTSKTVNVTRPTKKSSDGATTSSPTSGPDVSRYREASRVVPTTADQDAEKLALMQELDGERERRWKAEQAAIRLADHVKDLQSKAQEERELQDVAIQATSRLKHALMNEKETKARLDEQLQLCKDQIKDLSKALESSKNSEEDQRKAMQAMESTATKIETERLQQQAHETKRLQEYQMRAAAVGRELDLVKTQCKQQEGKIQQLQELLANREQEHRHQVDNLYRLDSREIQSVIQRELDREKERGKQDNKLYQERIQTLTKQYSDLENEFRMALQIEADRFRELQEAFQRVTHESASQKKALGTVTDKETRASSMVNELTAMVKEQKGRISEISKAKHEAYANAKDRIETLESHLDEAKRRLVQMDALKQEKSRLASQLVAQESVMEGLKAERKLWGQELAQQGASLAQDRGRLESRIEALNAEVVSLKKQSERENDALKIKTKMVDDQTDTIRKLKEGLVERDSEVKAAREEALQVQRGLEDQLATEQATNQDLNEQVERLTERKEELKQQVSDLQVELDESKRAYRALDNKWKEKGGLIDQLEKQVRQVKQTFDDKEKKLTEERDKALKAERLIAEKMKSMDDAFCQQLQSAERNHQETMQNLTRQKQDEIDQANQRVLQVEGEMRQLLAESANQKKVLEAKVRRLTQAFSDLESDLT
ncbi:leucine-rich repeat and coiled-coil domain-containing protein 1-like [Amphiura filiformis]|uniref:leucine-rich repeat and coiled-coil domain-containing protein 1-like n=1 Tax=Amphiura filiformis TaxID=82378 RepID=UPI003B221CB8